jgi:hypothetical protein
MELSSDLLGDVRNLPPQKVCPVLVRYSKEFEQAAAAEVRGTAPLNAHMVKLIDDYRKLRKACRVLQGSKTNG